MQLLADKKAKVRNVVGSKTRFSRIHEYELSPKNLTTSGAAKK